MEERRKHTRQQADWMAEIYADDTIYTSPVRNLSLGGAELIRPQQWKPKENHFCKICFSDMNPDHTLEVRMQICWIGSFSVGLKYHDLGMSQKIKLNKIISDITKTTVIPNSHFVM